ncbi:XkdX family protein [Lactobacillus delbrueckii subsp. lactis]|uniref:XkdX family protein n=1 Tax=Lactobacillus delbrueckii TaxID=1584 RepID=UPI00016291B3|nr:XkdX family protein [Lactobacillus delbrueckii]YP_007002988.1 hypothetical protein F367_gp25 [Lactobacillus phage JCL1032]ACB72567.1 hypothetical protein [Lactobacillus phage JCL1032]MCD5589834.1 XkdX family protein [Lactobacillus delbrueckii subsp. lactis]MCD5605795.1 XkdX family protein [Lactobacillus delbrueckii subsp. lactis]
MRSRIVKVVKYFFDNGNLTVDQIKRYVVVGTLTADEFKVITGEDYVVAEEASDGKTEEGDSQPAE